MAKSILRQDPESVLNLGPAKKIGRLSSKKLKGVKLPGAKTKNYKSPTR